tara:strand:- start:6718 stop:6999 length:282 start_codon:yes stop_codon:yes gene_type:complete
MAGRNKKLAQIRLRVNELNTAYQLLSLPIRQSVEINRYTENPDGTAKLNPKPYRLTNTVSGEDFGQLTPNECWLILTAQLRLLIKIKQHKESI